MNGSGNSGGTGPPVGGRIAPVLRAVSRGIVRAGHAIRRGVVAFDAPARVARTADDIRALEIERRAAGLVRRGGAGARAAAGRARIEAARAARVGGPALRRVWNRGAARVGAIRRPPPSRRTPDPAIPIEVPPPAAVHDRPRRRVPPRPLPLFEADGITPPIGPPTPSTGTAPPPPTTTMIAAPSPRLGWLDDRKTQVMIGIGGIGLGVLAMMIAGAHPADAPAPADSAAFGAAVRAYILDHPEIIPEAVAKLQQRDTTKMLSENRAALQTPFSGAWAGAADGDVTIVEFTDYACGFCRASVADVDRLIAGDQRLKIVFRELPILGPGSEDAAQVALSAARQGKHAALHRALFAAGPPDPAKTARVAAAAGLDPQKIARDRADPAVQQEMRHNEDLARAIGLSGTPTFVIGDRVLSGAVGYEALKDAVTAARASRAGG